MGSTLLQLMWHGGTSAKPAAECVLFLTSSSAQGYLFNYTIPESDPGMQSVPSGLFGFSPLFLIRLAQSSNHPPRQRCVMFLVQLDMTLQIVAEQAQLVWKTFIEIQHHGPKHIRDEVFAPEGKGGGDGVGGIRREDVPGGSNEDSRCLRQRRLFQCFVKRIPSPKSIEKVVYPGRVRS